MSKTSYFKLYADFHQIYVEDSGADLIVSASPDFWTEEAHSIGLAVAPKMISVGTARHGYVVVTVHIADVEPQDDLTTWDHVNQCRLSVPSGVLIVRGCTETPEESEKLEIAPGEYAVRIFYGNLDVVDIDDEEGDDHYKIVLWPREQEDGDANDGKPQVLKRYEG